jgi:hypothetical protein
MSASSTSPDVADVAAELAAREPIFHHPEFGTTRRDFERMMATDFWEVGASGRTYSREFVLDALEQRHRQPVVEELQVSDFRCQRLAEDHFLATYRLDQSGRLSRRATLWRRTDDGWKIVYHQGTLIADSP